MGKNIIQKIKPFGGGVIFALLIHVVRAGVTSKISANLPSILSRVGECVYLLNCLGWGYLLPQS